MEQYDYTKPAWFIFVHGDVEFTCNLNKLISQCDKGAISGSSGALRKRKNGVTKLIFVAYSDTHRRDDKSFQGEPNNIKFLDEEGTIDTLDLCCLAVHSSLVERYKLRFDDNIVLDFIAEDFCAQALVKHGIKTKLVPFLGCHHTNSNGYPELQNERFNRTRDYIADKYPDLCLAGTCGFLGGKDPSSLE